MRLLRQDVRVRDWQTRNEAIADIEIIIDVENLARELGCRAFGNKSKRCTQAGGLVRVRLIEVREVQSI